MHGQWQLFRIAVTKYIETRLTSEIWDPVSYTVNASVIFRQ